LLTRELGVPNACNRCHTDRDVEWSLAAVEKWYGQRMERRTRTRARAVAAVRRGEESAREALLSLLEGDDTPYWKASAAGLLEPLKDESRVRTALVNALYATNALVRASAVRALTQGNSDPDERSEATARSLWLDPDRGVRLAAAWVLNERLPPDSLANRELHHQLELNADQPAGQMQMAAWHSARGNSAQAAEHLITAVRWDPNSAAIRHELAVSFSSMGRGREALEQLRVAVQLEPKIAEYHYQLALAWNEVGDLSNAASELEAAVRLDPRHSRAWYNLGLARDQKGDPSGAVEALLRAESANPRDAGYPYARATILARSGRIGEARSAAARALELQPDSAEAQALVRSLGR
jgi:tetratricopeptide (TPR) repeat protein